MHGPRWVVGVGLHVPGVTNVAFHYPVAAGRGGLAGVKTMADRLPVNGDGNGFADALVIEGVPRDPGVVVPDPRYVGGRRLENLQISRLQFLNAAHRSRNQVGVAALEHGHAGIQFGHVPDLQNLVSGVLLVMVFKCSELDILAGHPVFPDVWAGPNRGFAEVFYAAYALEVGLREDHGPGRRCRSKEQRQRGLGFYGGNRDRVARHFKAGTQQRSYFQSEPAQGVLPNCPSPGPGNVLRSNVGAVVELHPLADGEGPGQLILGYLPLGGETRGQSSVGVLTNGVFEYFVVVNLGGAILPDIGVNTLETQVRTNRDNRTDRIHSTRESSGFRYLHRRWGGNNYSLYLFFYLHPYLFFHFYRYFADSFNFHFDGHFPFHHRLNNLGLGGSTGYHQGQAEETSQKKQRYLHVSHLSI